MIQCVIFEDELRHGRRIRGGTRESSDKISELQTSESCAVLNECIKSAFIMKALNQWVLHGLTNPCKIWCISLCLLWQLRKVKEIYKSCFFFFLQILVLIILYGLWNLTIIVLLASSFCIKG